MAPSLSPGRDVDIDNLIRTPKCSLANVHHFKDGGKRLLMFSNIDKCVKFIEASSVSKNTLFVISSGSLGRYLVPRIIDYKCVSIIYIFTCNIATQVHWAIQYVDKINIFDHELDLLVRLTRDLAEYYMRKALTSMKKSQQSLPYLRCAKTLFEKANIVDKESYGIGELRRIDSFIRQFEEYSPDEQRLRDGAMISVECSER